MRYCLYKNHFLISICFIKDKSDTSSRLSLDKSPDFQFASLASGSLSRYLCIKTTSATSNFPSLLTSPAVSALSPLKAPAGAPIASSIEKSVVRMLKCSYSLTLRECSHRMAYHIQVISKCKTNIC